MATDDLRPPQSPPPASPTRLELAREIEALRLAVREREGWIDGLRRELEERDTNYGWLDQEAKTTAAEAAAARREATQFREDRDHARKQVHVKAEEVSAGQERIAALEHEVRDLRVERRLRREEMIELRTRLDTSPLDEAPQDERLRAEEEARGRVERELADARADLQQARETLTGLADELAAVQDEAAREGSAALAGRAREIELLQRLSAQGDELAMVRSELDQLQAVLAEDRRTADARLDTLNTELLAARQESDKSVELRELAELHAELAALRDPAGVMPNVDLAARDARFAELERELASKSEQLNLLAAELQELRTRGFARYLEKE